MPPLSNPQVGTRGWRAKLEQRLLSWVPLLRNRFPTFYRNLLTTRQEVVRYYTKVRRMSIIFEQWRRAGKVAEIDVSVDGNCHVHLSPGSHEEYWRWKTLLTKEPDTIAWIDSFEPTAIFLDVGANVGVYSVYAILRHPALRLVALEPEPTHYMRLADNLQRVDASRATAYPFAASDVTGLGVLQQNAPGHAGSSNNQLEQFVNTRVVGCATVSLDDFVDPLGGTFPNYIKIDVDGVEPRIVKGMEFIRGDSRLRSVLVESQNAEMAAWLDQTFDQAGFRLTSGSEHGRGNRIYLR